MTEYLELRSEYAGTASFSEDGRYRWDLTRRWMPGSMVLWIMLNPSKADADHDDQTIRRCIHYSKREGRGGLVVVNQFGLRATQPDDMLAHEDPRGSRNMDAVCAWLASPMVDLVVAAWGGWWEGAPRGSRPTRPDIVTIAREFDRDLWCLGVTGSGAPKHPSRLGNSVPLMPYPPRG